MGPWALSADVVEKLWDAARQAQKHAYAPYSHFAVGAAVLDEMGDVHTGSNVENAAYPQGWCAETSAMAALITSGRRHVRGLLIVGSGGAWITPCGGCRQKLREFAELQTPVICASPTEMGPVYTLEQLLPHSFGPDHLEPV